jgi:hypothetical protein
MIPTAPVRWERFNISVAGEMSRDDLLQEMAAVVEQAMRKPCEKVWLIGWDVSGEGQLLESLRQRRFCAELVAELAELDPLPGTALHTHAIRVHESSPAARPIGVHDELASAFVARLEERFARRETALHDCLAGSALHGGPWEKRLETLLAELEAGEVAADACRMARHWIVAPEEVSS